MTKLLDEELEQDEMFWNQEALKDVSLFSFLSPTFNLLSFLFSLN